MSSDSATTPSLFATPSQTPDEIAERGTEPTPIPLPETFRGQRDLDEIERQLQRREFFIAERAEENRQNEERLREREEHNCDRERDQEAIFREREMRIIREDERLRDLREQPRLRETDHSLPTPAGWNASPPGDPRDNRTVEIIHTQPLCLLDDVITPELSIAFGNQARSKPQVNTGEVITGKAGMRIRLALTGDEQQLFVKPGDIIEWWRHVNVIQASEIILRYFSSPEAGSEVPIAEILMKMPLRFNMKYEDIEDMTFVTFEETIV